MHTGFFSNNLSRSFYFTFPAGGTVGKNSFSSGLSSYKIPLLIGRTIQWTENVSLSPQIGFSWLTNRRIGPAGKGGGSYGSRVKYTIESKAVNKNKFMAEAGLDVNISIFRNVTLKIGAQYSLGLQPMEKANVTYTINEQTYHGTLISKDSGWKFNIGFLFPLFSF